MRWFKDFAKKATKILSRNKIRYMIFVSFTLSAMVAVMLTGVTFYMRFSDQLNQSLEEQNQSIVEQANQSLGSILNSTNNLLDSISFNVIQRNLVNQDDMVEALDLFYQANLDTIASISVFSENGELISTVPAASSSYGDVTSENWFINAVMETENIHYSLPRVKTHFDTAADQYNYTWILSASCSVELSLGGTTSQGVLLIDLKYSAITNIFSTATLPNGGYIYLTDENGTIIYHPKHQLIESGITLENNIQNSNYRTGVYSETFNNHDRTIIVDSVAYAGWKIIGVIPENNLTFDIQNIIVILMIFFFYFGVITIVNAFISSRITDPIHKLERSVIALEHGIEDAMIYSGGSYEIQHLGRSIQKMVDQVRKLANDVVKEHEQKRISELNALQSQINPHFLYNTLDVIVWMVENEKPDQAVKIVSALARLFRISLSKGKNIITVADEIEHVRNYLTIQETRYKDKFTFNIHTESRAMEMGIIKLVIQPLVENSIYHGMEYMDGNGIIDIRAEIKGGDLYVSVKDNGLGIPPDIVDSLLTDERPISAKGSGIGLKNVNERLKLYFGEEYGVEIESVPDEGTTIILRAPAIPYGKMEDKASGKA